MRARTPHLTPGTGGTLRPRERNRGHGPQHADSGGATCDRERAEAPGVGDGPRLVLGDEQRDPGPGDVVLAAGRARAFVEVEDARAGGNDLGPATSRRFERGEHVDDRAGRRPEAVLHDDVHGAATDRDDAADAIAP